MRITTSWGYYDEEDCQLRDCERQYCKKHRLLWRDHETAKDDQDGAGQRWWALGDCPHCERESRQKEAQRYAEQWEKNHATA